jgi:hypothetical protein
MIMGSPVSEPGSLLLLGVASLATSLVLRRVLRGLVRAFSPTAKVDLHTQANLAK